MAYDSAFHYELGQAHVDALLERRGAAAAAALPA
jgi:hypothetical protein